MKFFINNSTDQKLTEKAFLQSITVSIISILVCIVLLCSTTWAWFTESVDSTDNNIKTGTFDVEVAVKQGGTLQIDPVSGFYYLEKNVNYIITIKSIGSSRAYCKLTIGNGNGYYTDIASNGEVRFALVFTNEYTPVDVIPVKIEAFWGTIVHTANIRMLENDQIYTDLDKGNVELVQPVTNETPPPPAETTSPSTEDFFVPVTTTPSTEITTPPAETTSSQTENFFTPTTTAPPAETTTSQFENFFVPETEPVETEAETIVVTSPAEDTDLGAMGDYFG